MLNNISRNQVAGGWVVLVFVTMVLSVAAGLGFSRSAATLWLFAAAVPPGIMLLLWPGMPSLTVADVLYPTETPKGEGRP